MLIDLKHEDGSHLQTLDVSLSRPPGVLRPRCGEPFALEWDQAVDDEMHLRRCPVCGGGDLYAKPRIPRLTLFTLIVLSAVLIMVLFGIGQVGLALGVLGVLVAADLLVYLYAGRELVCYRCGTHYRKLPIRRHHPRWDPALAQRLTDQRCGEAEPASPPAGETAPPERARASPD